MAKKRHRKKNKKTSAKAPIFLAMAGCGECSAAAGYWWSQSYLDIV